MNEKHLVSIIIPVFNVENYLDECISSVVNQDFRDWELILVDDGSTDGSREICNRWSRRDARVKVVLRENGGMSVARNTGIESAVGKFLLFVDSDDTIAPRTLASLVEVQANTGAGIVTTLSTTDKKKLSVLTSEFKTALDHVRIISGREAVKEMLYQDGVNASPCGKLFDADLWRDFRFRPGICYEDLDMIPQVTLEARKIAELPAYCYFYRQRPHSVLHTFGTVRMDVLEVTAALQKKLPAEFRRATSERRFSAAFNIFGLLQIHGKGNGDEADNCWKIIKELRKGILADSRTRLKSKMGALVALIGGRKIASLATRALYRGKV